MLNATLSSTQAASLRFENEASIAEQRAARAEKMLVGLHKNGITVPQYFSARFVPCELMEELMNHYNPLSCDAWMIDKIVLLCQGYFETKDAEEE